MNFMPPSQFLSFLEKFVNNSFGYNKISETVAHFWLKYSENVPLTEITQYQLARLNLIAKRASQLPFYKRIFEKQNFNLDNIKSPADLAKLPILYKSDFRKYLEVDYIDFELGKTRGYWVRTSGSTGEPFRLMRDKKYLARVKAFNLRIFEWFGISHDAKKANFIVPWGTPSAWWKPENDKYLSVADFQNKLREYADFLEWFKPTVLESNPSYLVFFAHYLAENKIKLHIPYLLSYGEHLFDEERKFLEKTFSGEVINRYGLTEITNIGVECPAREGFHLNALGCYMEIVNQQGWPIHDEHEGEIVLTSLINEIAPILRYGTGDRGRWIKKQCSCGRTLPLFKVEGRRDDVLHLSNGRIIYMNFFHPIFYKKIDKIRQFQIVQEKKSRVTVRLVPTRKLSSDDKKEILKDLKELLGPGIIVKISEEKEIPWLKSGKYKSVIRL